MISVFTATAAFTHVHKAVAPELRRSLGAPRCAPRAVRRPVGALAVCASERRVLMLFCNIVYLRIYRDHSAQIRVTVKRDRTETKSLVCRTPPRPAPVRAVRGPRREQPRRPAPRAAAKARAASSRAAVMCTRRARAKRLYIAQLYLAPEVIRGNQRPNCTWRWR